MGLEIFMYERPVNVDKDIWKSYNNYVLLTWINEYVFDITNCAHINISRSELNSLNEKLARVNESNCSEVLPNNWCHYGDESDENRGYGEDYWAEIEDLKNWVKKTLDTFDFDKNQLYFQAWW